MASTLETWTIFAHQRGGCWQRHWRCRRYLIARDMSNWVQPDADVSGGMITRSTPCTAHSTDSTSRTSPNAFSTSRSASGRKSEVERVRTRTRSPRSISSPATLLPTGRSRRSPDRAWKGRQLAQDGSFGDWHADGIDCRHCLASYPPAQGGRRFSVCLDVRILKGACRAGPPRAGRTESTECGMSKSRAGQTEPVHQQRPGRAHGDLVAYDEYIDAQLHTARRQVRNRRYSNRLTTLGGRDARSFHSGGGRRPSGDAGGLGPAGRWLALGHSTWPGRVSICGESLLPLCVYRIDPVCAAGHRAEQAFAEKRQPDQFFAASPPDGRTRAQRL